MMANPPLPRDVQDFQFKLVARLKVYDKCEEQVCGPMSLLAVSSKYGLVFVGSPSHLQIFETSVLLQSCGTKGGGSDTDIFPRHSIPLPSRPTHIGVSYDQVHVAVALAPKDSNQCPVAHIYSVASFTSKTPTPLWELRLSSTPGVTIQDIAWNPRLYLLICVCLCDGSVSVYELKGTSQNFEIYSLPKNIGARCISWSPKGKQLVIGTIHGPFIQYKPDLKQVKMIPSPQPGNLAPISLFWLSSFQFAVVYGSPMGNPNSGIRPGLYIVNCLKGEPESYINYEDICYSSGEQRPIQYYLNNLPKWNVLLMSSANSSEVGVLGADSSRGEPLVWEQWTPEDASRAEIPLSSSREEMYAAGMAIDTSPTIPLPWGENQTIPPAPLLLLLSHHGLLCSFNIINLRPGAAQDLCSPPEIIPGIRELLVPLGPSSLTPGTTIPELPKFGASTGVASDTFAVTSNTFSQSPLSSFAPSSQTLAAPTPSFFDTKNQKPADAGKGFLSGTQGSGSTMGFGGIGGAIASSKDATVPASSVPTAFSFGASTAVKPSGLTTSALPFSSQPQATPFSAQLPTLPVASIPAEATQQAPLPDQTYSSFGVAQPPLGLSLSVGDNKASAALSKDLVSTSKLKFDYPAQNTEIVGDKKEPGPNIEGAQQGWGIPKPVSDGPKTVTKVQETSSTPTAIQPPAAVVSSPIPDSAIFKAIKQETKLFEKELAQLKAQDQDLQIKIGSPEEKKILRVKVDAVEGFLNEVSETTQGQASEIAALRTLFIEAFAWVEEARSRQLYSKNPRYLHLAMVQGLDPVIKKHVMAVRNRIQYIESQLQQMDSNLDNQWETFQSACNRKNRKKHAWGRSDYEYGNQQFEKKDIHMPSLEYVYQTILSQQQILEKHKARLDELELKVRNRANWELNGKSLASIAGFQSSKKRESSTNRERPSIGEQDLSSMAESLLAMQISGSKFDGVAAERHCSKNPLLAKKMSSQKTGQICQLLAHRPMIRVVPSPRGMSSSNILQFPFKTTESKLSPPKNALKTEVSVPQMMNSSVSQASTLSVQPKVMPIPSKKELPTSKLLLNSASQPTAMAPLVKQKDAAVPASFGFGADVLSSKTSFSSGGVLFEASVHPVKPSDPGLGKSTVAPSTYESSIASMDRYSAFPIASDVRGKSPEVTTKNITFSGFGSAVSSATSMVASSSPPMTKTGPNAPDTSSLTQKVGPSTPAFSPPSSTKNVQPSQPSSIFSGIATSAVSSSSGEVDSKSFSTSGSFTFGSSSKLGGISTGKPVIPQTTYLQFVSTNKTSTSNVPVFSASTVGKTTKPSFSLTPKPMAQSAFTLPSTTFGSLSGSVSTSKEPLFVFGGIPSSNNSSTEAALEESNVSTQKESAEKDKISQPTEVSAVEKDTSGSGPTHESKEKPKSESITSTFSFTSALGQSAVSTGSVADSVPVSSPISVPVSLPISEPVSVSHSVPVSQPVSVPPSVPVSVPLPVPVSVPLPVPVSVPLPVPVSVPLPVPVSVPHSAPVSLPSAANITPTSAMIPNSAGETVTSTSQTEASSEKTVGEEKPAAARSLFSDFNFKLSTTKSEVFGAQRPASIFSGAGTSAPASVPVSAPIFGITSTVAPLPQSPVNLAPERLPTSLPIISETEPTTTTTTNPLSSLGSIVANLGSNTFGKSTAEESKPTPTFSAFSFALPAKDDPLKSLSSGAVSAQSSDGQKTNVQGFPSVSSAGADSSAAGIDSISDFGQGLANILGQSMSSSTSPIQQPTTQNPFAGSGSVFGSSTNSNSNTTSLFGKPAEGSVPVGLFGSTLKQEGATSPFYGNAAAATPTSSTVPAFGSGPFSQPASPSGSVFGGSGFGSKPVFGSGVGNTGFSLGGTVFGQSGGTQAPSTPSSIFGSPSAPSSGGIMFPSTAAPSGSVFGTGASGGSIFGTVAQSGFGSPSSSFQTKPGGFGGSPVFGTIAPGNTSPSFGGAATFGSPPTFGSHIFGSSVPSPGNGNIFSSGGTSSPSTFENLATAQTLTFGNLAQSGTTGGSAFGGPSQPQAPTAFGGSGVASGGAGSSSFGGSSFTSWR